MTNPPDEAVVQTLPRTGERGMNVLSLFDGMSCGQIALGRAGISVDKYFASEIDKYAIKVTQANYPDTIQLGDVTEWETWDLPKIDLLIGGSPCQGFSFAGKQLAFNDPRSALFFKYVDVLAKLRVSNPEIKFMLENVRMKQEHLDVISELLGVQPVKINSALVSAQNRVRYYWTNIGALEQPEDRCIVLSDVVDKDEQKECFSFLLGCGNNPGGILAKDGKIGSVTSSSWKHNNFLIKTDKKGNPKRDSSKASCLTGGAHSGGNHSDMDLILMNGKYRRYTPIECERLQTVPDNYTNHVSNTQRYKMLGNGWTVDVIAHIFKGLVE